MQDLSPRYSSQIFMMAGPGDEWTTRCLCISNEVTNKFRGADMVAPSYLKWEDCRLWSKPGQFCNTVSKYTNDGGRSSVVGSPWVGSPAPQEKRELAKACRSWYNWYRRNQRMAFFFLSLKVYFKQITKRLGEPGLHSESKARSGLLSETMSQKTKPKLHNEIQSLNKWINKRLALRTFKDR